MKINVLLYWFCWGLVVFRILCEVGYVTSMGEIINAYNIFVGKSDGKRPFLRRRSTQKDSMKMDLKKENMMVWVEHG